MKTQLLQDIGESQASSPPPKPGAAPAGDARQPDAGEPVGAAGPGQPRAADAPAFSVWKARAQPMPEPPIKHVEPLKPVEPVQSPEPVQPLEPMQSVPPEVKPAQASAAEMGWRHEPMFASENMDVPGLPPVPERPWFDRWGRRAAAWISGVAVVALLAGGAVWMVQLGKQEKALLLLAKSSIPAAVTAREPGRTPAVPSAVVSTPAPLAPPPVMPAVAPPEAATATSPPAMPAEPPPAGAAPRADASLAAAQPEAAPPPRRRPPSSRPRRESRKPAAKTAVADVASKPSRSRQMEETLRQCRAAGYHAAQCVRRRCEVTKYGLVCRG